MSINVAIIKKFSGNLEDQRTRFFEKSGFKYYFTWKMTGATTGFAPIAFPTSLKKHTSTSKKCENTGSLILILLETSKVLFL